MNKCACRGDFLDKFIQPGILLLLVEGPAHGFLLLSRLKDEDLVGESLDPAGLYRTLKKMETAGMISSQWDPAEKPKRVYSITEAGRHCLANWQFTLMEYRVHIETILEAIEDAIGPLDGRPFSPCSCQIESE